MATALDTHAQDKRLRDAGFDEGQAEAILAVRVEQLGELVTKDYLRAEIETLRNQIDERIRESERRLVRYLVSATGLLAALVTMLRFVGG